MANTFYHDIHSESKMRGDSSNANNKFERLANWDKFSFAENFPASKVTEQSVIRTTSLDYNKNRWI